MPPTAKLPAAVVFDFDGLLIDTETPLVEGWRETYASVGVPFPERLFHDAVGSASTMFDPLEPLRAAGCDAAVLHQLVAQARQRHHQLVKLQPLLPGVRDLLEEARQRGVPLGIASNSSSRWVAPHLATHAIADFFRAVCTRNDVAQCKPAPDVYLTAFARLGVEPARSLALEDSSRGVAAAVAAGARCIAVPGATTGAHDFSRAHAVIASLAGRTLGELAALAGL